MTSRFQDVLAGREDNYLFPFYWQHGNHTDRLPEQIERIFQSGCRGLCVESRTHEDFCREGWWRDMDIILAECEKRGMQVYILDDKHFPTGYANGAIRDKYPELRQWELIERHVDVIGPMAEASVLVRGGNADEILLSAYAYPRKKGEEELYGEPIELTSYIQEDTLTWDIPKGCYRIFFLYRSRRGGRAHYIDMLSKESVSVLIKEVYEPHYEHYARYFGNTLAGFFSDEPSLGNMIVDVQRVDRGMYERRVGSAGLALPYRDEVLSLMNEELGYDAACYLPELWYFGEHSPAVRLAYMNAVTKLYSECFCQALGDWCRARGVLYIGHIIEDMNAHARLHCSAGHYFRSLAGQDMSGIDVVLHQVMPGFADYIHTASCSGGVSDPGFYHYLLGQLASSMAHQYPLTKGRAMCEVFGAYGWGEGAPMMKWLLDFLLVRGINYFVPHAFSPNYPDPDCPPHFGAEGHDPQLEGFGALMRYTNRMAHLLSGGVHRAQAAILYHAEGEWMNEFGNAMLTEKPARALYDRQLSYDIVCADVLCDDAMTSVEGGSLVIGRERFGALIVPYAERLPQKILSRLSQLEEKGVYIVFADRSPKDSGFLALPCEVLADELISRGVYGIRLEKAHPHLRVYHVEHEGKATFFFFNESPDTPYEGGVTLPCEGSFVRMRLLEDLMYDDSAEKGKALLSLLPGQSEVWVFGEASGTLKAVSCNVKKTLSPMMTVSLADSDDLSSFKPYTVTDRLVSITSQEGMRRFAGKIRYAFTLRAEEGWMAPMLDLGAVGETARLFVNGKDLGIRVAAPYCFSLSEALRVGDNEIVVEVANTLAYRQRDHFSHYLTLRPSGLLGPITLSYYQK
ncbi:MAG: glycosyl transferase family 2 [Clostridia bacterium]|nr:glycosyl transferase family 2 [Clostridia bacterium]